MEVFSHWPREISSPFGRSSMTKSTLSSSAPSPHAVLRRKASVIDRYAYCVKTDPELMQEHQRLMLLSHDAYHLSDNAYGCSSSLPSTFLPVRSLGRLEGYENTQQTSRQLFIDTTRSKRHVPPELAHLDDSTNAIRVSPSRPSRVGVPPLTVPPPTAVGCTAIGPESRTKQPVVTTSPRLRHVPSREKLSRSISASSLKACAMISKLLGKDSDVPISKLSKSPKKSRKGPVAGTGHEGYGRFSLRGKSHSQTSLTTVIKSPPASPVLTIEPADYHDSASYSGKSSPYMNGPVSLSIDRQHSALSPSIWSFQSERFDSSNHSQVSSERYVSPIEPVSYRDTSPAVFELAGCSPPIQGLGDDSKDFGIIPMFFPDIEKSSGREKCFELADSSTRGCLAGDACYSDEEVWEEYDDILWYGSSSGDDDFI